MYDTIIIGRSCWDDRSLVCSSQHFKVAFDWRWPSWRPMNNTSDIENYPGYANITMTGSKTD